MKRRIFTAFLAVVLIFTMAIPALAASSYFYEGTYENIPYEFTASCTTGSARASTGYASTSRTVSTILKVTMSTGETLIYLSGEKMIEASVSMTGDDGSVDEAWCQFTVTGAVTKSTTLKPG